MSEKSPEDLLKEIEGDTSVKRFVRWDAFLEIVKGFERIGDRDKAENARTEYAAFLLITEGDHFPGYFQPFAVFTDGSTSPPRDLLSPERLRYLEQRARDSSNPIHASRFADVVWDFSQNIEMAHLAVDKYLECAELYKKNRWGLELAETLARSASLSAMISDTQRLTRVKRAILRYLDELDSAQEYRFGIDMIDTVAESHMVLTEIELRRVIIIADRAVAYYREKHPKRDDSLGPVDGPNENLVRLLHESKLKLAHAQTSYSTLLDAKQESLEIARSYEREGDLAQQQSRSLPALFLYIDAEKRFRDLGQTPDFKRLRVKLGKVGLQVDTEMEREPPISVAIEVSDSQVEEYIKPIFAPTLEETLQRISETKLFVPDVNAAESSFKPSLSSLFATVTLRDGHVTGRSVSDDQLKSKPLDDEMTVRISFMTPFISHLFAKLKREYSMNPDSLAAHFQRWGFCRSRNLSLLGKGFEHYFQEDYVSALHLLVPQVEDILRNLLREANRSVTIPPDSGRRGRAATLGSLLLDEEFRRVAGTSLIRYYRLVLDDPNGMNLRNDLAHGLMEVKTMSKSGVELILYVLLSLTRFRIERSNSGSGLQ